MSDDEIVMSAPDIGEAEIEAVVEVLRSGRLAMGPATMAFEEKVARHTGRAHAVALSSGTAALHVALRALHISPGDEVLVPSFTFAASVNAILYVGARPVFVDIEPDTYNVDPNDLAKKVSNHTKAILPVDVFGHPVDWDPILEVAQANDLLVIDDSCEALGATYRGRPAGSFGDAATFAFYPNKQITTGEGGMLVTDDAQLADACRSLRNQGRSRMGGWLEHQRLGYNYRMTEMSAALGSIQMNRLPEILRRRRQVAETYTRLFHEAGFTGTPAVRPHVDMSWFVYVITLPDGVDRGAVMSTLERQGIPSRAYFSPIHQQAYLRDYSIGPTSLPVTERVASRTLAIPFHNHLSERQAGAVVDAVREAIGAHSVIQEGTA